MDIVAVMGSPHRGNSLNLTRRFGKELARHGDVTFEYIHLREKNLEPCRGCFTCFLRGEEYCPLKDDKEEIARALDRADGVIFVSPVYAVHVTWLMKLFIDRFAYVFHRPRFAGKYSLALGTTGSMGLKEALGYLREVATSWGFAHVESHGIVALPKGMKAEPFIKEKDRTAEVAEKFYWAIKENRPRKLTLGDNMNFRMMRAVYSRMEEHSPTDHRYWKEKGWLEPGARYFIDNVKINPLKDSLAKLIAWYMGRQIDKSMAKDQ